MSRSAPTIAPTLCDTAIVVQSPSRRTSAERSATLDVLEDLTALWLRGRRGLRLENLLDHGSVDLPMDDQESDADLTQPAVERVGIPLPHALRLGMLVQVLERHQRRAREVDLVRVRSERRHLIEPMLELLVVILQLDAHEGCALEERNREQLELAALQKELEGRTERVFKHTSEKRGAKDEDTGEAKPARKGHGPREQAQLRIVEVVHTLDEADMPCPCCGERLVEIEGETEDSDEVDELQREFVIRRHRRQKYRCSKGCHVTTANAPKRWFEGGCYGLGFAISVAIAKYLDRLPLERQVRQMARLGLAVDSQTLFDQLFALAMLQRPAYLRLGERQRALHLLFVDETTWPVHESSKRVDASKWHLWTAVSPCGVYYEVHDNRGAEGATSILAGFEGSLAAHPRETPDVTDGVGGATRERQASEDPTT